MWKDRWIVTYLTEQTSLTRSVSNNGEFIWLGKVSSSLSPTVYFSISNCLAKTLKMLEALESGWVLFSVNSAHQCTSEGWTPAWSLSNIFWAWNLLKTIGIWYFLTKVCVTGTQLLAILGDPVLQHYNENNNNHRREQWKSVKDAQKMI